MKKRSTLICLLVLVLLLVQGMSAAAADAPRIQDRAAILSTQTFADADKLSRIVEDKTGLRIEIDIRHFLGGADIDSYAQRLLTQTQSSQNTLLLLVVVGEEAYAAAAGTNARKIIDPELYETLLSANFRREFLNQNYDSAISGFMLNSAKEAAKQSGAVIKLDGLFEDSVQKIESPDVTALPEATKRIKIFDFNSILREPISPTSDPSIGRAQSQREEKSLSIGSIIIIGLVLSSIFGKNKRGRSKGCGCGPLGWIFGVFGLSKFFGWRK
ncbi:MAG: TPM domain-containing protein [Clostridiales bacterium]|nr:TPM domain-containing protein [Clostridiales bacterium]